LRRLSTDFEYFAVTQARIKPKPNPNETEVITDDVPFIPNRGQRKLLRILESNRLAGKPIRIILLKARQWGGSTLIQIYMLWIQLFHRSQWNSIICAHQESTARIIRGMYTKALKHFPVSILDENTEELKLSPYEGSTKTGVLKQRGCRITIGSAERPDAVRGEDVVMAHCSEIGIWKATQGKSPEDMINSVCSGIPYVALSMIAYESTAKGVGNLFHREWMRAKEKKSNFIPVFVSWFEIENYSLPIDSHKKFIDEMSEYEWSLWEKGATLEQISWYRTESMKYTGEWQMRQEYPSDDVEAFQSSGKRKFNIYQVERLRKYCREPAGIYKVVAEATHGVDALKNIRLVEETSTKKDVNILEIWVKPSTEYIKNRYVVSVDIGGRSDRADWSIIKVFDRRYMMELGGVPEVVAQWSGHIEHYLLAWKAAQIAKLYNSALLVIESNTLETEGTEGQHFEYVLDEISEHYDNLYCRNNAERIRDGVPAKWGFHTNVSTKTLVADFMERMLAEEGYIERDAQTTFEMDTYEIRDDGKLGAIDGNHDDRLMATMIGVFVCYDFKYMPLPEYYIPAAKESKTEKYYSEAIF
jgi:hypothetical protein